MRSKRLRFYTLEPGERLRCNDKPHIFLTRKLMGDGTHSGTPVAVQVTDHHDTVRELHAFSVKAAVNSFSRVPSR